MRLAPFAVSSHETQQSFLFGCHTLPVVGAAIGVAKIPEFARLSIVPNSPKFWTAVNLSWACAADAESRPSRLLAWMLPAVSVMIMFAMFGERSTTSAIVLILVTKGKSGIT